MLIRKTKRSHNAVLWNYAGLYAVLAVPFMLNSIFVTEPEQIPLIHKLFSGNAILQLWTFCIIAITALTCVFSIVTGRRNILVKTLRTPGVRRNAAILWLAVGSIAALIGSTR